jgi:hypothetical protein
MTVSAGAAGADAGDDHPIADGDRAHGRPYLDDRSNSFVAEDAAGLHGWHVALEDVEVCPADRSGVDAGDDVSGLLLNGSIRYLLPCLIPWAVVDQCSHRDILPLGLQQ